MNDFTKEELILIRYLINNMDETRLTHSKPLILVQSKIQSLIDNYCEHEWENICCQCTLDKIYCHKCKKDMGDLKERYDE